MNRQVCDETDLRSTIWFYPCIVIPDSQALSGICFVTEAGVVGGRPVLISPPWTI